MIISNKQHNRVHGDVDDVVNNPRLVVPRWVCFLFLAVIILALAIRVRLLAVPVERDEGEYAYAGQLMLQGFPPYSLAYNMKMPGIYAAYALILAIFGQTHEGIHLGLLVINAATILLLFLLAKQLFDSFTAWVASAVFAVLSLGQYVHGLYANAEHFVIVLALAGILLLYYAEKLQSWWHLLTGSLLLGLAFLMKQHAAAFILFGGFFLVFSKFSRRPLDWKIFLIKGAVFVISVILPFALTCLILWRCGVFDRFWFWTFSYAREYVSQVSIYDGFNLLAFGITPVFTSAVFLWILAAVGFVCIPVSKRFRQQKLFVLGFLIFSFFAVCPGLYFRGHYFLFLLPPAALLAGIGADFIRHTFAQSKLKSSADLITVVLVFVFLLFTFYQQRYLFFVASPNKVTEVVQGGNAFPESLEVAEFLRQHSQKNDKIAVVGSEPQIYFYSNRRSGTGYIYMYPLMEPQPYALKMQQDMISEIEAAKPDFLIFVHVFLSWIVEEKSENLIFEWFENYSHEYYRRIGVVDIPFTSPTIYRWGGECAGYEPKSDSWILIFERKK